MITAASELALALCGEPEDRVQRHLDSACVPMEQRLAGELGAAKAATVVAALKRGTLRLKGKLDELLVTKTLH
jgi:hypothetical protein